MAKHRVYHPTRICRECGKLFKLGGTPRKDYCQGPILDTPQGQELSHKFADERAAVVKAGANH